MPRLIRVAVTHLRAQWMGALALFFVIAGGTAYAANTVFSSDIVNGEVKSADIATEAVRHAEVADGVLNDEDVGELAIVGSAVSIGTVNAHACKDLVLGIDAEGDHLLLTPDHTDAARSARLTRSTIGENPGRAWVLRWVGRFVPIRRLTAPGAGVAAP